MSKRTSGRRSSSSRALTQVHCAPVQPDRVAQLYEKASTCGFTIIERMVVVIVFVLSAIAIPAAVTIERNHRTRGDAQVITAKLELTRIGASATFMHARGHRDASLAAREDAIVSRDRLGRIFDQRNASTNGFLIMLIRDAND